MLGTPSKDVEEGCPGPLQDTVEERHEHEHEPNGSAEHGGGVVGTCTEATATFLWWWRDEAEGAEVVMSLPNVEYTAEQEPISSADNLQI